MTSGEFSGSLENTPMANICTVSLSSQLKCVSVSSWHCDVGKIKLRFPQVSTRVVSNMPTRCICPTPGLEAELRDGSRVCHPRAWMQQKLTDQRTNWQVSSRPRSTVWFGESISEGRFKACFCSPVTLLGIHLEEALSPYNT